ncbi:hypothetical protein JZO79_11955 [Vagococcus fluvialis]|uniref:hypothetical protein n=1 Tax=Vagococcus fluvialis TaxID=2738 RepID=UPI001A8FEF9D|nr:hypothetical protein [Vagococcus fluvialis]MBO0444328.1 hypothetical protein [Vagococcus fluvialis]
MKKIGLIVLAIITAYFTITIGWYLLKEEKRFTKDEAITLFDSVQTKIPDDKRFHTDKQVYKNNEEVIFYRDNKPLVSWEFTNVTTKKLDDISGFGDLNQDDIIRMEFKVKNFNYLEGSEPYEPLHRSSYVWVTDQGEELFQSASIPFDPINKDEDSTYIYFLHSDKSVMKAKKVFMRFYYHENLLDLPIGTRANYVDFDLDISH